MIRTLAKATLYARLAWRDRRAGAQLRCVRDRVGGLARDAILLVACLRNEQSRMAAFAAHHRALGVDHFLLIDNGSDDGFLDWAMAQPDVSVWRTEASYKDAAFGMLWCNDLLRRYGVGRWCVTVDPDEFLIFPFYETRGLRALTSFLDEERRPCLHAVLIDAYSDRPLSQTVLEDGADPFALCPYFDRDGYVQAPGFGKGVWVRGGPRLRRHFRDDPEAAPALNKIPLVKWRIGYHYVHSTHDARPWRLNQARGADGAAPTGALMHFKFTAGLTDKAQEEAARNQHYASGREYARYRDMDEASLHVPGLSVRFTGSRQLTALGLMSPGRWF